MFYEGTIYRPPSEAKSLILQITVGCKHNTCTFCTMYKDKTFRIKTRKEIEDIITTAQRNDPHAERIFLADGDALAADTPLLLEILATLYRRFPNLKRVGIYGGPLDILSKSPDELAQLRVHGLTMVYLGVESGSAQVLKLAGKGVTPDQMIQAGQKIKESGLMLSCTIIIGLGGKARSQEHALETARILNAICPHYLGALTLMTEPEAPLAQAIERGVFYPLTPLESLHELRTLIEHLEVSHCIFRSNHASNYLPLRATLPDNRSDLLQTLDNIINTHAVEKLRPEGWRGL